MTKNQIIDHLIKKNDHTYNMLKAAEELQELSLAIIQRLSKDGNDDNIIEEIGDVKIRLAVIEKQLSRKKINKRIKFKLKSIKKHIVKGKYGNRV